MKRIWRRAAASTVRHCDTTSFVTTALVGLFVIGGLGGGERLKIFVFCYVVSLLFTVVVSLVERVSAGFSDDLDDAARFLGPVRVMAFLLILCLLDPHARGDFTLLAENLTAAAGLLSAFVDLRATRAESRHRGRKPSLAAPDASADTEKSS